MGESTLSPLSATFLLFPFASSSPNRVNMEGKGLLKLSSKSLLSLVSTLLPSYKPPSFLFSFDPDIRHTSFSQVRVEENGCQKSQIYWEEGGERSIRNFNYHGWSVEV